jgi:AAHS family 4-hydroxybenzoate transporter-like MFS transporter
MTATRINVVDVIDHGRLGMLLYGVMGLCTLCTLIDGFDVQAMSYVAPAIIKEWGIAKSELGQVFGSGLVGMAVGALVFGTVADRIGRRPVLIGAMLFLAAFVYATAHASSVRELLLLRFATGLCMGAVIPNAIALAGEYSPARMRVTLMMIASSGLVLGGAVGGLIAAALIPAFGWRSVFLVGAALPLLTVLVMLAVLPESLQFLATRRRSGQKLRALLRRIDPALNMNEHTEFVMPERRMEGAPFMHLFRDSLGMGTVLLWAVNFMNLMAAYFLANWLPVIMNEAGHSTSQAVLAGTVLWGGGFIGNLFLGWFVDRNGFGPTLSLTFIVAALAIALIGQVAGSLEMAFLVIAVTGFCVLGGQNAVNALAAMYYPTAMRSTGMGWALGIGRFGSIFGPVVGGELLSLHWSSSSLFIAAAVPAVLSLLAIVVFWSSGRLPATASTANAVAEAASVHA